MNQKAQARYDELTGQINELVTEASSIPLPDSTRRAVIACDIRALMTERGNLENNRNPVYFTTSNLLLASIVARVLITASKVIKL